MDPVQDAILAALDLKLEDSDAGVVPAALPRRDLVDARGNVAMALRVVEDARDVGRVGQETRMVLADLLREALGLLREKKG